MRYRLKEAIGEHPKGFEFEGTERGHRVFLVGSLDLVSFARNLCEPLPETDAVDHPSHYTSHSSGVECITIARHMTFNVGNAIKYLWRAGLKGSSTQVEDLKKAAWYLQDEIKRLEGEGK